MHCLIWSLQANETGVIIPVLEMKKIKLWEFIKDPSVQFSSVAQSSPTPCDPMNRSTPGLPVRHLLPELLKTMSIESVIPRIHKKPQKFKSFCPFPKTDFSQDHTLKGNILLYISRVPTQASFTHFLKNYVNWRLTTLQYCFTHC